MSSKVTMTSTITSSPYSLIKIMSCLRTKRAHQKLFLIIIASKCLGIALNTVVNNVVTFHPGCTIVGIVVQHLSFDFVLETITSTETITLAEIFRAFELQHAKFCLMKFHSENLI
ncbi:hypothetical protein CEXT_699811 [Caerostris extrusa]|uniref:Uncharacterized protein n=1 Tax=Caerostris extrusa TaxID=172846 RepID=A0AAV4PMI6_CAEEX|nr:hypothetical protein CEXT_699811 [Caerostris extrusa]